MSWGAQGLIERLDVSCTADLASKGCHSALSRDSYGAHSLECGRLRQLVIKDVRPRPSGQPAEVHVTGRFSNRKKAALGITVLALFVVLANPANAQPPHLEETGQQASGPTSSDPMDRFAPAVSVFGGFLAQRSEGSLSSGLVFGPGFPADPLKIRPAADGRDTPLAAVVGGSFELMAPRFCKAIGCPRLFAHGDVAFALSDPRTIAGEAKPGTLALPPDLPQVVRRNIPEAAVSGQGSSTVSQLQDTVYSAGLGVAFTFEVFERTVRIKPSVEYLHEEIEVTGLVNRAVKRDPTAAPGAPADPAFRATSFSDFRLIYLNASQKKAFNGIGPGLEVEGDAARLGPLVLSVYLSGSGYRFIGNRKVSLTDTNSDGDGCNLEGDCETASWEFEHDPWAWRGNVGLRFRWQPE